MELIINNSREMNEIDEQIKIGNLFQTLDQQVNQQETKLKYLKQRKQAYLQNMFV